MWLISSGKVWRYLQTKNKKLRRKMSDIKISRLRLQISRDHFKYHAVNVFYPFVLTVKRSVGCEVKFCLSTYVVSFRTKYKPNADFIYSDLHFLDKDVARISKCRATNTVEIFVVLLKRFAKFIISRAVTRKCKSRICFK